MKYTLLIILLILPLISIADDLKEKYYKIKKNEYENFYTGMFDQSNLDENIAEILKNDVVLAVEELSVSKIKCEIGSIEKLPDPIKHMWYFLNIENSGDLEGNINALRTYIEATYKSKKYIKIAKERIHSKKCHKLEVKKVSNAFDGIIEKLTELKKKI